MPKGKNGNIIKKIKVNKKAIAVIFSNGDRIDISEEAYTSNFLYVGKELSDQDIAKLKQITSVKKLSQYAMNLLTKHHYTEWKMREKLYAKGGVKEDVDYIINKLKELDLINDKEFIEDYLGYSEEKKIGKNKIKQELIKKGIFAEEIEKIRFNSRTEIKKAIALIPSLEKKYSKYSYQQKRQRIYVALLAKGFDVEVANEALSHMSSKVDKDEKNKLKIDYKKVHDRYKKKYSGHELKEKVMRSLLSKGYKYSDVTAIMGGNNDDF